MKNMRWKIWYQLTYYASPRRQSSFAHYHNILFNFPIGDDSCSNIFANMEITEGIYRGVFQNFNPLCGRNPMRTDLD